LRYRELIGISFLLNGLLMIGNKSVGELGLTRHLPVVILTLYCVALALALIHWLMGREPLRRSCIWTGVMAGAGSMIGMSSAITAMASIPGYIVFPLIGGGTIVLVTLAGRLAFGERLGPYGIAGTALGICAIVLLSI